MQFKYALAKFLFDLGQCKIHQNVKYFFVLNSFMKNNKQDNRIYCISNEENNSVSEFAQKPSHLGQSLINGLTKEIANIGSQTFTSSRFKII